MGDINLLTVFLAAAAFFVVGMIWYGALFGKVWQKAAGLSDEFVAQGNMPMIFGLCFLFELLVSVMLAHLYAMTNPSDINMIMIALGVGATFMVPAIGISYLYLRKSALHFVIDAAHYILGMGAMGAVYVLMK